MSENAQINVLFVSDDPDNKYSVKVLLKDMSCDLHRSKSSIRAQKLLSVIPFNLVIADLDIPKTTGIEFCKTVRSDKKFRNIPVIVVGEDSKDGTHCVSAFEAGANDFIEFPFVHRVFSARVKRFLSKKPQAGAKAFLSVQVSSGDLPGVLQYLEAELKTGKLNIKGSEEKIAVLCFKEGRLVNATAPYCNGLDAVTEVLSWQSSHVTFQELELNDSEMQFDYETTGTIMNCVVDVDEFHEIQKSIPSNDVMFQLGSKKPTSDMEAGQKKIYEFALKGYSTDDLLTLQKVSLRNATIWLHQLIDNEYLTVSPSPFQHYQTDCHETYRNSQIFIKRLCDIRSLMADIEFPLPDPPSSLPFGARDWLAPAPKIIMTGDNFDNISILVQSLSDIATYISKTKSLVRKHLKGVVSTRLFFDPKEILDIQQLPPAFDKLFLNTLNEFLTDVYAVIFVVTAQDKKTNQENLRMLRILRQRFKGIYYFIVPTIPNRNNLSEFRIDCSHCDNKLSVDMGMAGAVGACPICNASLTIPDCLDHLAHSLLLPDEVPIAQLTPSVPDQCRDLFVLIVESILNSLKPPEIQPLDTAESHDAITREQTDVRERLHSSNLQILAAVDDVGEIAKESSGLPQNEASQFVEDNEDMHSEEAYSEISLDEILNTDEDQFDIDEFIKNVRKAK